MHNQTDIEFLESMGFEFGFDNSVFIQYSKLRSSITCDGVGSMISINCYGAVYEVEGVNGLIRFKTWTVLTDTASL